MDHKIKKLALGLALALSLTACAQETGTVPVSQVSMLRAASLSSEKFAGVVVSENAVKIPREMEKTVAELYVKQGDTVQAGQKLFSYDSEELGLTLDRQELDLERLKAGADEKEKQIAEVQKELNSAKGDNRTALNIQLRQLKADLTQAKFDRQAKQREIDATKKMLENVDVVSPIDGTIRKIDEANAETYLLIQQAGAYRIRGSLNELSLKAGLMQGSEVTVVSRLDDTVTWKGTVTEVDYNNTVGGENGSAGAMSGGMMGSVMIGGNGMMGGSGSTSYPFYVTLESTEGLLLGQHVYIRLGGAQEPDGRVLVPTPYLLGIGEEEIGSTAQVLTPGSDGRLEKRPVTLGEYVAAIDCYEILNGLSETDYLADPTSSEAREGAMTDQRSEADYEAPSTQPTQSVDGEDFGEDDDLEMDEEMWIEESEFQPVEGESMAAAEG